MKKLFFLLLTILTSVISVSAQEISIDALQKRIFDLHDARLKSSTVQAEEQQELINQVIEFYNDRLGAERKETLLGNAAFIERELGKPYLQNYKLDVKVIDKSIRENEDGITFKAEISTVEVTNCFDDESGEQIISEGVETMTYTIVDGKSLKISKEVESNILEAPEGTSGKSGDNYTLFDEAESKTLDIMPVAYSASSAITYAYTYYANPNPAYSDYSTSSGGDCTNFLSQCLKKGGWATVTSKPAGASNPYILWYYNSYSNKSTSWAGAQFFNEFVRLNPGNARVTTKFVQLQIPTNASSNTTFTSKISTLSLGAILQQSFSSNAYTNIGHSMLVTKKMAIWYL
jgi:hypothetical protein